MGLRQLIGGFGGFTQVPTPTPPLATPVSVANGGTGRTTKLPYTLLGTGASAFTTTANNGNAYEIVTGLTYVAGLSSAWVSNAWTAPETGLLLVTYNVPNDGFSNAAAVDLFRNGSLTCRLRSLMLANISGAAIIKVTAADVLTFRAASNEATHSIYINDPGTNASFVYQPNF